MVIEFFRIPARRNPRQTSVTTDEERQRAAGQDSTARKWSNTTWARATSASRRTASVPTTTTRNNPGALQREAMCICRMERSVSCLVDCR